MKNKIISIASAALMFFGIASANAHTNEGPYVSATGSFVFANDMERSSVQAAQKGATTTFDLDSTFGGSLAIGYTVDQWRVELEGLYRKNKLNKMKTEGFTPATANKTVDVTGSNRNIALMANIYYDIPLDCNFGAYVGAGAGVAFNKFEHTHTDKVVRPVAATHSTTSTLFAWQVMGGLTYDIAENVTAFAGYRLFATGKPSAKVVGDNGKIVESKFKNIPLSHSIDVGIRYRF